MRPLRCRLYPPLAPFSSGRLGRICGGLSKALPRTIMVLLPAAFGLSTHFPHRPEVQRLECRCVIIGAACPTPARGVTGTNSHDGSADAKRCSLSSLYASCASRAKKSRLLIRLITSYPIAEIQNCSGTANYSRSVRRVTVARSSARKPARLSFGLMRRGGPSIDGAMHHRPASNAAMHRHLRGREGGQRKSPTIDSADQRPPIAHASAIGNMTPHKDFITWQGREIPSARLLSRDETK